MPIAERAQLVLDAEVDADWVQSHKWPEVVAPANAYGDAVGQAQPLSAYSRDSGVRAIVCLLAAFPVEDVVWVAANEPWLRGKGRGLSAMSPQVVRTALGSRPSVLPADPLARRMLMAPQSDESRQARSRLMNSAEAGSFGPEFQARAVAARARGAAPVLALEFGYQLERLEQERRLPVLQRTEAPASVLGRAPAQRPVRESLAAEFMPGIMNVLKGTG